MNKPVIKLKAKRIIFERFRRNSNIEYLRIFTGATRFSIRETQGSFL